ncbi:MAG: hypothetical protein IKJ32_03510 [Clostridia bacterium]|nr:hypothetical protein [Clostridia bacterium]
MGKLLDKFSDKKKVENLITFLILLVILIVALNSIYNEDESQAIENKEVNSLNTRNESYKTEFEIRLENILSKINGAGEVSVMVSYENEVKKIPMVDTKNTTTVTSEKDSAGGERKTEETNIEEIVIYESNGNLKSPVIQEYTVPKILGVIVVAEGAKDMTVKEKLINAVTSITDVASHKIQVLEK